MEENTYIRFDWAMKHMVKDNTRTPGLAEGRAEGRADAIVTVAKNLIAMGMDNEAITQVTGLTADKIEKIHNI